MANIKTTAKKIKSPNQWVCTQKCLTGRTQQKFFNPSMRQKTFTILALTMLILTKEQT